jgi:Fe-S cluster assembly protein SufD
MATVAERQSTFAAAFEALRRDPAFATGPAAAVRNTAFARFSERGLPSTRDEEWRFTNVTPIAQAGFAPAARPASVDQAAADAFAIPGAGLAGGYRHPRR